MAEENIRTYQFNVPGFIPGIPGNWSAGQWVTVDEDSKTVLDWGPKPIVIETTTIEPETPPALDLSPENIERAMNTPIFEDGPKLEGVPPIMQAG